MNARTPGPEAAEALPTGGAAPATTAPGQPAPVTSGLPGARPSPNGGRPAREPRPVDPALEELWKEFKATGDGDVRERLILHYAPLVKYVAGRGGVGLPPNIEQADLVSSGIFGLIDAIEKLTSTGRSSS